MPPVTIASTTSSDSLAQWPLTRLPGVGPKVAEKLQKLQLHSVQDVLFHLPYRYQDRTRLTPIGSLRPQTEALLQGEVLLSQVQFGKRRSLLVRISDGTGQLTLRFFHFNKEQQDSFQPGRQIRVFGEARRGANSLEIVHPEYRFVQEETFSAVDTALTPIYPATEGFRQATLRKLADQALALMHNHHDRLQEWLPAPLLQQLRLPDLHQALQTLHHPTPDISLAQLLEGEHPCQQRLVFEELLAHHLSVKRLRHQIRRHRAPALPSANQLSQRLLASLPFELTGAQQRVSAAISEDLQQTSPMLRLVQGDVGSGKTIVAALAALQAVEAGYQVAIMAPTELLAEQHVQNFRNWLQPLGVEVGWLAGKLKGKAREQALSHIASGQAQVVIGTHALFQDEVQFSRLGLIIIDEQHRFGVHQRLSLREKGRHSGKLPHQLVMTATPIPRTLAMTAYADLDVSVINELPKGRQPVDTVVINENRRADVVERVRLACQQGRQVYWVCPLIEESEQLDYQAAIDTAAELSAALPELTVLLVHGRMKPAEKEEVMARFKAGEAQLLVATTVIEVGVDVPNASLMIIENAERLGLSQLHQLRGRVGRGSVKSSCVLMYKPPLSNHGRERLAAMRRTSDGFEIARIDLELRGPGELLGTRQTGLAQMRIADLIRDQHLLPQIERAADLLFQQYPDNISPLIQRWLPQGLRYSDV
ncbi:MAG: ATP-dependent DNA helicase RecG [Gammaproteobacteria bacterium]|nr:ATP-dependent DNA helicase RecG [Gammaproteobacteria bacterium]